MRPRTARRPRRGVDPSPRPFPVHFGWSPSRRSSSSSAGLPSGSSPGAPQGPPPTDAMAVQVHASMGGFEPGALTVKAGQAVRVEFFSMDTAFHSDGGGWHQPATDALGVVGTVGPEAG